MASDGWRRTTTGQACDALEEVVPNYQYLLFRDGTTTVDIAANVLNAFILHKDAIDGIRRSPRRYCNPKHPTMNRYPVSACRIGEYPTAQEYAEYDWWDQGDFDNEHSGWSDSEGRTEAA
ncbi:hypothetical protein CYMTET_30106 [Cymbomonas tetramitiformis]|uniref:Uncharacterized protein n=1 Tax=Cymbomonas tetramitiformis TaxID=36881 RepID=A0AAE0FJH6_9CHLO|nr:hypothetical protein CYMTET_30106 [Cymbomonas tetramitiformis]